MRRVLLCAGVLVLLCLVFSVRCRAATLDTLEDSLDGLRENVSDEVWERMRALGYDGDLASLSGIGVRDVLSQVGDELLAGMAGPLSSCAVIVGVILLAALLEGYTHSLRYTETKDVMAAVTSLMIASTLIAPLVSLISRTVGVIGDTATLMLAYVPIMIGILSFSGHAVQAGGSCTVVMTASQAVAQLAAHFVPQVMSAYLGLSVAAGVSGKVRLNGICEMIGRFLKWFLIFMMTLFSAVLSLQSMITRAADTVATRAVRFTLSSLIPLIGSAVSEAYQTIRGSVDLLRSGAGVFVILAICAAFLPILVQVMLWLVSVNISKSIAETLNVSSPASLLSSVATALGVLTALVICTMSVFIISTAALIRTGAAT